MRGSGYSGFPKAPFVTISYIERGDQMARPKVKIVRVQGAIDPGDPGKTRYQTVMRDGETIRLRVVDADSPAFGAQFLSLFRSNVRRARKENRQLDKAS